MKWLMSFLFGVLVGAAGLFVVLRTVPDDPAPAAAPMPAQGMADAGVGAAGEQAAANPAAGVPLPRLDSRLPGPQDIEPDLSEFELPVRPVAAVAPAGGPAGSSPANSTQRQAPANSMQGQAPANSTQGQAPADAVAAAVYGKLLVPVQGVKRADLRNTYDQPRGNQRQHEALDIMAPKGTPVLAVADGKVAKLFASKPGGTTLYQFDPSEKYAYYYAHLDRYAEGIKEGMEIKRGDVIGYVGVTGNSDPNAPHLHFAVFELTPEKQWWKGTPVNPYPLMTDAAQASR